MNAFDMLDDSFPHGTVEGFNQGCKGAHCPAPMACRDVRTRYHADWGFRKAVDSGMTAAELLERETAQAAASAESDRAAAAAERQVQIDAAKAERAARRPARAPRAPGAPRAPRAPREVPPIAADVTHLHTQGLNDREIAERIGVSRPYVTLTRRRLGLQPVARPTRQPRAPREPRAPEIARLHALGMRDDQIAAEMGLSGSYVGNLRRDLGLPTHPLPPRPKKPSRHQPRQDRRPDVAAGHAEGLTDRQISERVGLSPSEVGRLRRDLGLQVNRSRASRWDHTERLPHGTNASYARGCRCEPCHQAQRAYYREYTRRRRAEGIPTEHHGTPYGYQLGCRGRKACPAETTCTDAMLEEERRRRREAGIPPAADRVAAEPVREHTRALMNTGMSVIGIAETAGVSRSGIKTLLYGRTGPRAGEFPAHIEAEKAERLLALEVTA